MTRWSEKICDVTVKRTFVHFTNGVQTGMRRSLSCGDLAQENVSLYPDAKHMESRPFRTGSLGSDMHDGASSQATSSTAAREVASASQDPAFDGDESCAGSWESPATRCTRATGSPTRRLSHPQSETLATSCSTQAQTLGCESMSVAQDMDMASSDREARVEQTLHDQLVVLRTHSGGLCCSDDEGGSAAHAPGPQVEVWTEELMQDIWEAVAGVEQVLDHVHCQSRGEALSFPEATQALLHLAKSVDRNVACDEQEWQASEPRFAELIRAVRKSSSLAEPSMLAQMIWSLGKLNACGGDVTLMIDHLAAQLQAPAFSCFTCMQLSDTLWGLGRIADKTSCCRPPAKRIARLILVESLERLSEFSPNSLVDAVWAVAKLRLAAVGMAGTFVKSCVAHLCREGCISKLSSHSVATTLWSIAKLRLDTREVSSLCTAVAREVDPESLRSFVTVDLSISLWAMAKMIRKCIRRSESSRSQPQSSKPCYGAEASKSASSILVALTQEAFSRGNAEFSQQALTNISWALTTLELTGHIGAAASEGAAIPCDGSPEDCSIVNASCATCPAAADATAAAKTACLGVQLGDVQLAAAVVA